MGLFELLARTPVGWVFAGVWGALWGSFVNVCIWRVGLYESVVRPRSRCPACGGAIAGYDNIPVVSWLLLGGRCRRCRAPISWRYPLVELLTAGLALGVYARFVAGEEGDPALLLARFFVYFAFAATLVVLSGIDLDHLIIPDRITYPAIPVFFICGLVLRERAPLDLLLGAIVGYGIVALVAELFYWILKKEAMGYGDAKLLMLVGALLGWRGVMYAFFVAPFLGLLITVPVKLAQGRRVTGVQVPYGPFLAAAATAYLFFGRYVTALLP
jgi:leader peptidase (prepilin peptidase)/N-methyltransferase